MFGKSTIEDAPTMLCETSRAVIVLLHACLIFLTLLFGTDQASAQDLTLSATPTSVSGGGVVTTTLTTPVAGAGVITQELIQTFDPSGLFLTGVGDITQPSGGWSLSYCTLDTQCPNAGDWSSVVPTNWGTVTGVKSVGTITSMTPYLGRQVTSTTSTQAVAVQSFASPTQSTGDGWNVFFDKNDHVFNIYHHDYHAGGGSLDCHVISTGARCDSTNWPFLLVSNGAITYHTNTLAQGWFDPATKFVWMPTNMADPVNAGAWLTGFGCIDVSNIAAPTYCGGTASNGFVQLGTGSPATVVYPNQSNDPTIDATFKLAQVGTRLFTWEHSSGNLLCVDTSLQGGRGGACPGQPYAIPGSATNADPSASSLEAWGGRIYVSYFAQGTGGPYPPYTVSCFDPASPQSSSPTLVTCGSGWPRLLRYMIAAGMSYEQPDPVTGDAQAVCFLNNSYASYDCYAPDGSIVTPNSGLSAAVGGDSYFMGQSPTRVGTRVYWANGNITNQGSGSKLYCYDVATSSSCPNWPITEMNYTMVVDPLNSNCLWSNNDQDNIKTWDAVAGNSQSSYTSPPSGTQPHGTCVTAPSKLTLTAAQVAPLLGCSAASARTGWGNFTLLSPTVGVNYTSATLTVLTATGGNIANFSNLPIPTTDPRTVDLSGLSIADSGELPQFIVNFVGLSLPVSGSLNLSASVVAIGSAPQLCLNLTSQTMSCPVAPTSPLTLPPNLSLPGTINGAGSVVSSGSSFTPQSVAVSQANYTDAACLTSQGGQALILNTSTVVPGAVVYLQDSNGNPVLDQNAQPVSVSTDSSGNYNFPRLFPDSYKLVFASTANNLSPATYSGSGIMATDTSVGVSPAVNGDFIVNHYTVTGTASPTAGGVVACISPDVAYGDSSSCLATPNPGYSFSNWSGDCAGSTACSFNNVTANKTVVGNFTKNTVASTGTGTNLMTANLLTDACSGFESASFAPAPGTAPNSDPYVYSEFTFTTSCNSVTIRLTVPQLVEGRSKFWKYDAGQWHDWTNHANVIIDYSAKTVTYTIFDNGEGDGNAAVGVITDPVRFSFGVDPSQGTVGVPSVSRFGMGILGCLMGLAGFWMLRRTELARRHRR